MNPNQSSPLALRASSMGMFLACQHSMDEPELKISTAGTPAHLGNAIHELAALYTMGNPASVSEVAMKWDVPEADLEMLFHKVTGAWEDLRGAYLNPVAESHFEFSRKKYFISGTVDLHSVCETAPAHVNILDWKSGYKTVGFWNQMLTYTTLILLKHLDIPVAHMSLVNLRYNEVVTHTIVREQAFEFMNNLDEVVDIYLAGDAPHVIGEQCRWCRNRYKCEALMVHNRQAIEVFGQKDNLDLQKVIAAGDFHKLWAMSKLIGDLIVRFEEQAKQYLLDQLERGEEARIELSTPQYLTLKTQAKRTIHDALVRETLLKSYSVEQVWQAAKFGMGTIKKMVGDHADKGCKGRDQKEVVEVLQDAGAIEVSDSYRFKVEED